MDEQTVLTLIQLKAKKAGSQKALADEIGVSPAYLSDIIQKNRPLSVEFLSKIGLEMVTTYRRSSK